LIIFFGGFSRDGTSQRLLNTKIRNEYDVSR
jgi:hypothetical protein